MSSKLSFAGYGLLLMVPLSNAVVGCSGDSSDQSRASRAAELNPEGNEFVLDEGSRPANCSVLDGVDFVPVITFEGGASQWYKYDDGTSTKPLVLRGTGTMFDSWGEPSQDLSMADPCVAAQPAIGTRCGSTFAAHAIGGAFSNWGGGIGTGYFKLTGELATINADPATPGATEVTFTAAAALKGIDVSSYQGIGFWARRGPTSQTSFKIGLSDKYTNENAARKMWNYWATQAADGIAEGPYCPLTRTCGCSADKSCSPVPAAAPQACTDNSACASDSCVDGFCADPTYCWNPDTDPAPGTPVADPGLCGCGLPPCNVDPATGNYFCWNPEVDPPPSADATYTSCNKAGGVTYPACGSTACKGNSTEPNAVLDHSACTDFTTSDGIHDKYCYDAGSDPEPVPSNQKCGGVWGTSVVVGADWKFYRIPFNELAQDSYGWQSPDFALDNVWGLTITFGAGSVDFYIDDIGFYR